MSKQFFNGTSAHIRLFSAIHSFSACTRARYSCHLTLLTMITFTSRHNHPLNSADVLQRRDMSDGVQDKFLQLFAAGHSPSGALEMHKCDLQTAKYYAVVSADRYFCSDLHWCCRKRNER